MILLLAAALLTADSMHARRRRRASLRYEPASERAVFNSINDNVDDLLDEAKLLDAQASGAERAGACCWGETRRGNLAN